MRTGVAPVIRAALSARSRPVATVATVATVGAVAPRRVRGRVASVVVVLLALAAMAGLLVARPVGALAGGGAAVARPVVEVASAGRAPAAAPTRIGRRPSPPLTVPTVRPGHDATHLVRSVPLPPGWLAASVGVALLVSIGLVALVESVEPMAPARAGARGRGPPVRR